MEREQQSAATDHPTTVAGPTDPAIGLTAAEVVARRQRGLGNDAPETGGRTYLQIAVENTFTFTNNIMFLLGLGLVIVGRPLDALVSVLVVGTNVVVGVVQEVRAKRTLDRISLLTRPTANVIRDGETQTVSPQELVVGDLVKVQAGDQFVLDGRLVEGRLQADESLLTGESDLVRKDPGEEVFSGSFCATGSGRYVVEKVGTQSLANRITQGARAFRRVLTPLQRNVNSVIRLALVLVLYMELLLLLSAIINVAAPGETIAQASVLAGLIPNGLFVSIAVAYALGAVRLVRFGALVQQANAVESLSRVDVLCTDKTGTLTANRLTLRELAPIAADEEGLRRSLGTLLACTTERTKTLDAIAAGVDGGDAAPVKREVPFSSARKWSGVTLEDGTTYVLGAPQLLRSALAEPHYTDWPRIEAQISERAAQGLRVLMLLTSADADAIKGDDEDARLSPTFAPLGLVVLEDELRPGVGAILERFRGAGVQIKIISGDDPDTVVALARQAGLTGDLPQVSGAQLDELDDRELAAVARRNIVFGRITPTQKERLVAALREGGAYVAMIGDGVNDVLSLKKSNLAVAMASGSQASRGVADIVLTEDSFAALAPAVEEGQRIVNGMFDIISLFLARIATMGLVIVSALVVGIFPIALRNASAITLLSVGIPAALLALWAQPGKVQHQSLTRMVIRFVLPAALISSVAALTVFFGSIWLSLNAQSAAGTVFGEASVIAATPAAQSALTAFLVFVGLGLIVFVEPPTDWLAVTQTRSPDLRPTLLALVLALVFVGLTLIRPLGDLFALAPIEPSQWALVLGAFVAWLVVMRQTWKWRLMERFVGA